MAVKNRTPTIADVAQKAKVSIATVSRVLNGTTPVDVEKTDWVRLMNGHPAEALTLMRTELVIRESCGCRPPLANDPQDEFLTSTRR